MKRWTLFGRSFPLVRREGVWTGFFFFQAAQVMGPSGVWMIVSSRDSAITLVYTMLLMGARLWAASEDDPPQPRR